MQDIPQTRAGMIERIFDLCGFDMTTRDQIRHVYDDLPDDELHARVIRVTDGKMQAGMYAYCHWLHPAYAPHLYNLKSVTCP